MDKELNLTQPEIDQLVRATGTIVMGSSVIPWHLVMKLLRHQNPNYWFDGPYSSYDIFLHLAVSAVRDKNVDKLKEVIKLIPSAVKNQVLWDTLSSITIPCETAQQIIDVISEEPGFYWKSDQVKLNNLILYSLRNNSPAIANKLIGEIDAFNEEAIIPLLKYSATSLNVDLFDRLSKMPGASSINWYTILIRALAEGYECLFDQDWKEERREMIEHVQSWINTLPYSTHDKKLKNLIAAWLVKNNQLDLLKWLVKVDKSCLEEENYLLSRKIIYKSAIESGNINLINFLLDNGVVPDTKSHYASEMVRQVMEKNNFDVLQHMLDAGFSLPENWRVGPYFIPCATNSIEMFNFIYERIKSQYSGGQVNWQETIDQAINNGSYNIVERIIELGLFDINTLSAYTKEMMYPNAIGSLDESKFDNFIATVKVLEKHGVTISTARISTNNREKFKIINRAIEHNRIEALTYALNEGWLGDNIHYYFAKIAELAYEVQSTKLVHALYKHNSSPRRWSSIRSKIGPNKAAWIVKQIPDPKIQERIIRDLVVDELVIKGEDAI